MGELRTVGLFPYPTGLAANRTAIRMMVHYCYEQRLIEDPSSSPRNYSFRWSSLGVSVVQELEAREIAEVAGVSPCPAQLPFRRTDTIHS